MPVVLIVDDESKVRELLRQWLERAGYQTLEAQDATAALAMLAVHAAGVVLVDVHMPGHDGLWLARQIREQYPASAVVFATGVEVLPPADTLRDGVVAYVLKPFDRGPLLDAVGRAVRWHDAAKARRSSAPDETGIDRWLKDESSE
jgi:DNA-binding NtrC family response regulator